MTTRSAPRAIGVDGAPGGWVAAVLCHTNPIELTFTEVFADIVASAVSGDIMVVDMPIGLSSNGHRPVDAAVRARLGPRRSTFFPTPVRSVVDFTNWELANEHSRQVSGKGLSKQAWNLVPKIAEVDAAWDAVPDGQLREGHPETSFAEMSGAPLATKKSTAAGRRERVELLTSALQLDVMTAVDSLPKTWSIDAVDALALAWTAQRATNGTAGHLGGERDALGRPMELWF